MAKATRGSQRKEVAGEVSMQTGILGQQVASYQIVELVGVGGVGDVYLARHADSGRFAAIKVARVASADEQCVRRMHQHFSRELELLRLLRYCRYVVDVLGSGQTEGRRPFLILEHIEGWDLQDEVDTRGPLSPADTLGLLRPLCMAVQAVHDLGVAHLDLKPQNVMLPRNGRPGIVLLDFGIARRLNQQPRRTGRIEGSPLFMAPEQLTCDDDRIGTPADVYALGTLAYLMLSARLPFECGERWSAVDIVRARVRRRPVPLAIRAPHLPQDLTLLVDSCLATDAIARPASPMALYHAFRQLATGRHARPRRAADLRGLHMASAETLLGAQ